MKIHYTLKELFTILFFIGLGSAVSAQWSQLGQDVMAEGPVYGFGRTVGLSGDGLTMAVACTVGDSAPNNSAVYVYSFVSDVWIQKGQRLLSEFNIDHFGTSVSLTPDGQYIAVGAYKHNSNNAYLDGQTVIYKYVSDVWVKQGEGINGEAGGDYSGLSVSISADGQIVAIGSPLNAGNGLDAGQTRVFNFSDGAWVQMGGDIDGDAAHDRAGGSVDLCADGQILIVGSMCSNDQPGKAKIYHFEGEQWLQMGETILGSYVGDNFGYMVQISNDGQTIAAAANHSNEIESNPNQGQLRVFNWTDGLWTQQGQTIYEVLNSALPIIAISLSGNGQVVAFGLAKGTVYNSKVGKVKVFGFEGTNWEQWGTDFIGNYFGASAVEFICLNEDGMRLAIGEGQNSDDIPSVGRVKTYQYTSTGFNSINSLEGIRVYPNPSSGRIQIDFPNDEASHISVFDLSGKILKQFNTNKNHTILDLSALESGMYFIHISNDKGMTVEKILLNH